jgi:small subunit ribosomal protein S1
MAEEVNSKVLETQEEETKNINEEITEEEDFATMLEASFKNDGGSLIEGTIIEIKEDSVMVDVGKKLEGRLNISEILDNEGVQLFNSGDKVKVLVTGYRNERPIVSYRKALKKEKVKEFIDNFTDDMLDSVVEGKIVSKNRGGYLVQGDDGVEFFLPRSQAAYSDPNKAIGKKIKAKILKIDKENESIVISRRKYLDEERKKKNEIIEKLIESGEPVEGVIKKITSYGMFVDVGGVDGLVHYSEISYKGPVNPNKFFSEEERVLVKAINYDKEKRHLSLSIKAATPDPWEEIEEQLDVGDIVKVVVSNIEPYGVFVDIGNDIEGFLHISEISWDKNIKHPKDYLKLDEEIDVEVIEINSENRRLRVSLKSVLPKPFDEFLKNYKEGDVATGTITTLTNFGAFVKIGSVEGLLHNEDVSWDRGQKCKDIFSVGDEVEVKILRIDRDSEKISLSRKALLESPISIFAKSHKVGDIVKGRVRDKKDFGVFVEIEKGVDGLIRTEDLGEVKFDEINSGDEIEAVIAFIDEKRDRIRLSVKRLNRAREQQALKNLNNGDDDKMTLGDIIKDQLKQ